MSYYLASCIGLVFILKYGSILKSVRNALSKYNFFAELFKCSLCLGFWAGALHFFALCLFEPFEFKYVLMPLVSAAVCWGIDGLVQMIQAVDVYLMSHRKKD